jgi:inositol-1,3,4-trisphosphate 5/6-kinase/inositol-tetrakisphosphate 1-kinase
LWFCETKSKGEEEMSGEVALFEVGYALAEKKIRSFVQPSLIDHARSKGVNLVCVDTCKPLEEQGPFDAIIHKLAGEEWSKQLADYEVRHPGVIIVDAPEAIEKLHNRISMLQAVAQVQISEGRATCGIPNQLVVENAEMLSNAKAIACLTFPVIAKPLVADGSAKSHAMFLIFNIEGLAKLKPPMVLQEFVNHGGVIFKVYVAGEYIKCVRRISLPDVHEDQIESMEGPVSFSQISNMAAASGQSGALVDENLSKAELPPASFIADMANGLREALGLRLFNFDVIRDTKVGNHYHIIDINYFPGYAKMPAYENVLTDFFLGLAREKAGATASESLAAIANQLSTSLE